MRNTKRIAAALRFNTTVAVEPPMQATAAAERGRTDRTFVRSSDTFEGRVGQDMFARCLALTDRAAALARTR